MQMAAPEGFDGEFPEEYLGLNDQGCSMHGLNLEGGLTVPEGEQRADKHEAYGGDEWSPRSSTGALGLTKDMQVPARSEVPPPCIDFPRDEGGFSHEHVGDRTQFLEGDPADECHVKEESNPGLITGPRYFVPEVVYAPSDVDPEDILYIPDDSCPNQERLEADSQSMTSVSLQLHSWNVAGMSAKNVKMLVSHELHADVIGLQEYPKQNAGWQMVTGEVYSGLIYQNYFMYRAVSILYKNKTFHLLGRKSSERGMWVHLRHVQTSQSLWIGCIHVPNSEPRDEIRRLLHQFMSEIPPRAGVGSVLGDFNTHFNWSVQDGVCVPRIVSSRWADLRQAMSEFGFRQVPPQPEQADTPTFHSRKGNVARTQIDGGFVKGLECQLQIREGSRAQAGTDHDRVELLGVLKGKPSNKLASRRGGPMRVVQPPPPVETIDQQTLEHIASRHCKPASLGDRFRPSPAVRTLREMARECSMTTRKRT